MPIVKANTLEMSYKHRSKHKNINELNGRGKKRALTDFICENIAKEIQLANDYTIVDIGCGDCTFFKKLMGKNAKKTGIKMIGLLPNIEEITKVSNHLSKDGELQKYNVELRLGKLGDLGLNKNCADIIVMNSVLHGVISNWNDAEQLILEIKHILKPNGIFYLGEIPSINELANRSYPDDSIIGWLTWSIRKQGIAKFLVNSYSVVKCVISSEPFIIEPKSRLSIEPATLIKKMANIGFVCDKFTNHLELDDLGNITQSATRWNYIFQLTK